MKKKIFIIRCAKLLCLILCFVLLSGLALDCCRYYDYNVNRLAGFYAEPRNTLDVVLLGSSEVFTGFSSGLAYELFGFTSYPYALDAVPGVLFESQVREITKYQNPQWILVDINGFLYDDPEVHTDGGRLRRYLNNIPFSWNRIKTITEMVPSEEWYFYFYPLAKSHDNWKEVWNQRDKILDYYKIKWNGSVLKGNVTSVYNGELPQALDVYHDDSTLPLEKMSEQYLRSFLEYCRENGIKILFVRFPHIISDDQLVDRHKRGNEAKRIVAEYGIPFVDLEQEAAAIGLDYTKDFYNEDHLNVYGQQKLTAYMGKILVEQYGVVPGALTQKQKESWNTSAEYTRLFFAYYDVCLENGKLGAMDETRSLIFQLTQMKEAK
ncbi:MAG: SGNH/GDSL hydrolase family protein [Oscillospiraceae bacterium]|nr:SGNH/GDSL hydrolase family protein [Oscillospiraceae bacterium]